MYGPPRPPFFPPFMPPNPFAMGARFPMIPPHHMPGGMISPISQIITNGNGIGSEENFGESTNITPNSIIYDNTQSSSVNGITDQNTLSSTMNPQSLGTCYSKVFISLIFIFMHLDHGDDQTKNKSKNQKKLSKDEKDKKKKSKKNKDLSTTTTTTINTHMEDV
ncbi:unnamed protein product [Didymodactylos carnosus]|uniref:Uncharacterized protein n=1 Tax=Didymodactylos carnosus TaxID=1234261 RepID=A0A814HJL5_9BILA|nr:unnamed protein product [Didymodactylos carnosus]CAF1427816.1 unnamed protein product [Didymodactylos carnosus]CAF3782366.1 unnamed protein product [Didymodactylos carnosus]CAF4226621.1 unnamed protein product [Didymodactylos carnosus]